MFAWQIAPQAVNISTYICTPPKTNRILNPGSQMNILKQVKMVGSCTEQLYQSKTDRMMS